MINSHYTVMIKIWNGLWFFFGAGVMDSNRRVWNQLLFIIFIHIILNSPFFSSVWNLLLYTSCPKCKQHSPSSSPWRPLLTTYLGRQAPCQSSCCQSGRHGALSPRRENNLADRCTPECSRRRAGLDPQRQHRLGSAVACRSELKSKQRADLLVQAHPNWAVRTHKH